MPENASMAVDNFWAPRHRNFRLEKVENGWKIEAAFMEEVERSGIDRDIAAHIGEPQKTKRQFKATYVFHEIEEMMLWIRGYVEAEELR